MRFFAAPGSNAAWPGRQEVAGDSFDRPRRKNRAKNAATPMMMKIQNFFSASKNTPSFANKPALAAI
jgi:hypothetical protein